MAKEISTAKKIATNQVQITAEDLREVMKWDFSLPQTSEKLLVAIQVEKDLKDDLSWYRVQLIKQVMERIYSKSGWKLASKEEENKADIKLLLSINSVPTKDFENTTWQRVTVGVVRNVKTKQKERDVNVNQFISMREKDIASNDGNCSLARATVDFELLHVNATSCVNLKFDPPPVTNRGSSNRGITFCLYNFARIAIILRKHEERVLSGEYPPLPELDSQIIDQLRDMDPEMQLIRCCLWKYKQVLKEVVPADATKIPELHLLCRFLSEISHPISRYYRTYHVLTEPSPHLLPVMHTRIHMLILIKKVLISIFELLGVEPLTSM